VGGYTTGKQSEEEEEAGAGQGTRGGVHYGHTVRGGEGGCRARHTWGGTLRANSQRRRRRVQGKAHVGGYTTGEQSKEEAAGAEAAGAGQGARGGVHYEQTVRGATATVGGPHHHQGVLPHNEQRP
jgi:hypothetical protein